MGACPSRFVPVGYIYSRVRELREIEKALEMFLIFALYTKDTYNYREHSFQ